MLIVEGTVEDIIYSNEINGYTVCDIKCDEKIVTAVGYMPFLNVGENVKITGKLVNHPEYGDQLKVELYEKVLPQTAEAIEKYLASGVIKGVGPATAARIVKTFGKDTLDIMNFRPQMLAEVKGISLDKAVRIGQAFDEQRGLRNIVLFLQEFGISPACCMKIHKAFGDRAVNEIKQNPYKLSDDIFGIGFKTADRIAMSMGIDPASGFRICSGIKHVLSEAAGNGHTYFPEDKLKEYTCRLLQTNLTDIENSLISLVLDRIVVAEKQDGINRIYLSSFFNAELGVCRKLIELSLADFDSKINDIDIKLLKIEKEEGIELAGMQKTAIEEALKRGVLVITGGPGTGKTTIIKGIIKLLEREGHKAALAAPTGRAAKRMSEATGYEARTIHRLLEIGYTGDNRDRDLLFQRNENNPLEADVIIIDEVSMVDVLLMNHLLKAVPPGARLILAGDINQLPSVGAGNVLKDIINSGLVKTVKLTEIFRQAQESMIIVNAHRINNGEMPCLNVKGKDFFFVPRSNAENVVRAVTDLCCRRLPDTYGYEPLRQIQVLTPARKGPAGVVNLNIELQKVLNLPGGNKCEKVYKDYIFREGDRVMQVKNNYSLRWAKAGQSYIEGTGVFNGDTGIISRIDEKAQIIEVTFEEDRVVEYDFTILDEIEPAFAVTVHKSQGSEFPVVVMPVFSGPPVLMTRNLLYTAVTRARDLVVLVGDEGALADMVANEREMLRYSGLADKLKRQKSEIRE
ncbi:MAG: ATP-dependent RecD-like DNA helicase [Ruminiclostridium sp.]|nr:ATP-dependent RecD-like DNA helicase [Ruminiclostridium sp.]